MAEIQLTKGMTAIVDDHWFPILNKWSWYYGKYAVRDVGGQSVYMHRYITMVPDGLQVDHINGNKLDNREANLRVVLAEQNYYNRTKQSNNKSGFKGVCYDKTRDKWMASISVGRKQRNLGRFDSAEDAAIAYDKSALKLHGEYALTNGLYIPS